MLSKPKIPKVVEQLEKNHNTFPKNNLTTRKIESEIPLVDEVKEPSKESGEETVNKERKENPELKVKTKSLTTEPSENQFVVENLGMLYASWSDTVRIDRETLSSWGREIKEIEIETVHGKITRCKVKPMDSKKGIIQIPDKMQLNLEIRKGELVRVKPVGESRNESTIRNMIARMRLELAHALWNDFIGK